MPTSLTQRPPEMGAAVFYATASGRAGEYWFNDRPHPNPLPQERERAKTRPLNSLTVWLIPSRPFSKAREPVHPLLGGEGRGEGERHSKKRLDYE